MDEVTQVWPRRRVRGLRVTALPSLPLAVQLLGGVSALAGVWLLWGGAATMLVGGVCAVVLGMLREGGKI